MTVTGDPMRLDRFLLRTTLPEGVGRRRLAAMLGAGEVRVNGRAARKGTLVRAGDEVTIVRLPTAAAPLVPTPGRLVVVYADDRLVAIDKPPGMPAVGGPTPGASVAGRLLARFPEMAAIEARRAAGLVHRLDTGTSGLLVAARRQDVHLRLRGEFTRRAVEKAYLAVVRGHLAHAGTIVQPLRRRSPNRARMIGARARDRRAWPARTDFAPLLHARDMTLVRLRMRTGVTHQLRVHLAMLGHPIVGDARYGRDGTIAGWHYLHAAALRFDALDLPRGLSTAFPAHWRALFTRLRWPASRELLTA